MPAPLVGADGDHRVGRAAGDASGRLAQRIAANWLPGERGVGVQDWEKRIVDVPLVEASSTQVRSLLDQEQSAERDAQLRSLLHPAVYEQVLSMERGR